MQARQVFVYATAARLFGNDRWAAVARGGCSAFLARHRRLDGAFATLADEEGGVLDSTPTTYDQAFAILGLSALAELGDAPAYEVEALKVLGAIADRQTAEGGFKELGERPFQANANMHLFEAAMWWERPGSDARWGELSDTLASFAMRRLLDSETGLLREYFDADWRPVAKASNLVEPGHLFEWSWLLGRWARRRGDRTAERRAGRLFHLGLHGIDGDRGVAINSMWEDFTPRDPSARLWPQTEYLKAALLSENEAEALAACNVLAGFLATPLTGAWRDKMGPDGAYLTEPAPASSFYHILMALIELFSSSGASHPDEC